MEQKPPKRRANDTLEIVDDEDPNSLTVSDVREMKKLLKLSKSIQIIVVALISVVAIFGADTVIDYTSRFLKAIRAH